ncbi:MAG: hypothetical protein JXR96_10385 [Deltaproteobacteria bacterium]|nr:hypothetical protein [Deltaproteobacteria bacterium]
MDRPGILLAALSLLAVSGLCGCDAEPEPALPTEADLRARLGIPEQAERVIVFGQNAHLDPGWQHTIPDYYDLFVEQIFLQAAQLLDEQPRYYYSICEISFLDHHVREHPEELARLVRHAASGRLRIVGGGVTSPDTLLPSTEDLLRDYLLGRAWVTDRLGVTPHTAWLPDSFGHSPTTPDILSAAGYTGVGFARTDGMRTPYLTDFAGLDPIMPGSTAATLAELESSTFVWKGPFGGRVLAHLMPVHLYCQGDNIDHDGMPVPGGWLWGTERTDREYTHKSIAHFIEELEPFSRTPYMFVPVGCDFQLPKHGLVEYMDAWNAERFPETGTWALAATFEDFMDLIRFHASDLPELELDMNPYFTGFYASRPELKRLQRAASAALLIAEIFSLLLEDERSSAVQATQKEIWWDVAVANHHDFVTGTSTDEVYAVEQIPMLEHAASRAERIWSQVAGQIASSVDTSASGSALAAVVFNPASQRRDRVVHLDLELQPGQARDLSVRDAEGALPSQVLSARRHADGSLERAELAFVARGLPALGYGSYGIDPAPGQAAGGVCLEMLSAGAPTQDPSAADEVVMENGLVRAVLSRQAGWALTSLVDLERGREMLRAPSAGLVPYRDDGGLWRLGMETPGVQGCGFTAGEDLTASGGDLSVLHAGPVVAAVQIASPPGTRDYVREFRLEESAGWLELLAEGAASEGFTITTRIESAVRDGVLSTAVPAGMVQRPFEKIFSPTFWPVTECADLSAPAAGMGLSVLTAQSTGVSADESGRLEVLLLRNARSEKCDILGGVGTDPARHRLRLALYPHAGDASSARVLEAGLAYNAPARAVWTDSHAGALPDSGALVTLGEGAWVSALKRAEDGNGFVIRLSGGEPVLEIEPGLLDFGSAVYVDAIERSLDLPPPAWQARRLLAVHRGALTSLRLFAGP